MKVNAFSIIKPRIFLLKLLLALYIGLFFVSCGGENIDSSTTQAKQFLSISRSIPSSGVSIFQNISLEFSTVLNSSSVMADSAYILDKDNGVVGAHIEVSLNKIVFTPYQYLKPAAQYKLVITTAVKNEAGQSLSQDYNYSFITQNEVIDASPLIFNSIKPSNALQNVDPKTDISIQFNKFISPDAQYEKRDTIKVTSSGGEVVSGELEFFNSIITFKPTHELNTSAYYNVELVGDITDMYGNVYNGDKNWSFTTASGSVEINKGYTSLYNKNLNSVSSLMRTMRIGQTDEYLAVASSNKIDFFDVIFDKGYPSVAFKYTFDAGSQINDMYVIDSEYILVGTMSSGVYVLRLSSTGSDEVSHLASATSIYGVTYDADSSIISGKAYAVGPKHGLEVFSLDSNKILSSIKTTGVEGTLLKVAVANDGGVKKVFVADYDHGVKVFDENGTHMSSMDLNGSTRDVTLLRDNYGSQFILASNSLGVITGLNMDSSVNSNYRMEFLSSASDINTYVDSLTYRSMCYASNPSKGLLVINNSFNFALDGVIQSAGHIVSSSIIKDDVAYVATLDQEGVINIFNAIADTYGPYVNNVTPPDGANINGTDNIQASFSEYLDKDSLFFTLVDLNTSENIGLTITSDGLVGVESSFVYTLNPDKDLTPTHSYRLSMSKNIKDRFGNALENYGMDYNVSYVINTPPPVSGATGI